LLWLTSPPPETMSRSASVSWMMDDIFSISL
jgi:hypothetical protein